jgi:hypothetical protein
MPQSVKNSRTLKRKDEDIDEDIADEKVGGF